MRRRPWGAHARTSLAIAATFVGCSAGSTPVTPFSGGDASTSDASSPIDATTGVDAGAKDAAPDVGVVVHHDAAPTNDGPPPPPPCGTPPARGAAVPYQEYEAEDGTTSGTVLGPSRAVNDGNVFNSIAGESSGRRAVKLSGAGQRISFTTACATNSVVVRYAIPDSGDGNGIRATLGVYVGANRVASLQLTSHYAWAYGDPTKTDATTNTPSDGFARHFYDEARVLLPADVPAGATIALQQDASDTAPWYVVDLVDLEYAPAPLARVANSLSITDYGATPDDGSDDGAAIQKCLNAASVENKVAWIPPGTFNDGGTTLVAQNVAVRGAGMWRSTIQGAASGFVCGGGWCQFSDMTVLGDVTLRDDAHGVHAFGGPFGANSRLDNVWMEHFTTGPWIGQSGSPAVNGIVISGCRIRDLFADGVNLNTGTSNATVQQCHARNTGDDAFASWSSGPGANSNNVFSFDSVQVTWRASCFALYGGNGNAVRDSTCADTVTYPGVFVDQDFGSTPFAGTTSVARNTLTRAGGGMFGRQWGALTIAGTQQSSAITGVQVQNVDIESPTFSGVYLLGPNDAIQDLVLDTMTIANAGTYGIHVDQSASGIATATNVVVTSPGSGTGLYNQAASVYTIDRGGGDVGW